VKGPNSMPSQPPDDSHTTGGRRFITPAHPGMVAALGRALWNFLALEETAVAILYMAGGRASGEILAEARALDAGGKKEKLQALRDSEAAEGWSPELAQLLERGIADFDSARRTRRNALLHAHAFTVEFSGDHYQPGLAHTNRRQEVVYLARNTDELLDIAEEIERSGRSLDRFRVAYEVFLGEREAE
jgi:hypothetical protein